MESKDNTAKCFYHMDNISHFKINKKTNEKDGLFISESHYLYDLIQQNQYDTIYHGTYVIIV